MNDNDRARLVAWVKLREGLEESGRFVVDDGLEDEDPEEHYGDDGDNGRGDALLDAWKEGLIDLDTGGES